MDEAVAGAIISLRGIKGIVESEVYRVRITSEEDTSELRLGKVYDVTETVRTALEVT